MKKYRIHGDNIVECERIAKLIIRETQPYDYTIELVSPSTITYILFFEYAGKKRSWELQLLPGFNKAGRSRWSGNIFSALKETGSFLDETPDAIITSIDLNENTETILCAIEFCSALQAGNQAWQRSGRAFSTGRTSCPYIYIVDFVKYELDPKSRERKALRFPNPAVPYSYINFAKETGNFIAQVYVRSEEFDKSTDTQLNDFNENDFAESELSQYIVKLMCDLPTDSEERLILQKNLNVVLFLSRKSNQDTNFTEHQWKEIFENDENIIEYSKKLSKFNFHKTVTAKGHHGKSPDFIDLVDNISIGIASRDLPFGIIPAKKRDVFAESLQELYPNYDKEILNKIAVTDKDLVLCIIKGFKPRGDDNRPDRGILPLATMLTSTDTEIMTYIYGPIIERNFNLLISHPKQLANSNGLWKSILGLSNYIALDVPILSTNNYDQTTLIDCTELKNYYTDERKFSYDITRPLFSSVPQEYHEDDVDAGIHFLFSHVLPKYCFEGMCNPPGGDWSGFSILQKRSEVRWLSLPRVSEEVDGKRPDHIIEIFTVFEKPLLLSIESKERSNDLERNVGKGLVRYIQHLMNYVPNVIRSFERGEDRSWKRASKLVDKNDFEFISAAAYLKHNSQSNDIVFANSACDLLFIMEPSSSGWTIELIPKTAEAMELKKFIINKVDNSDPDINIF